MGIGGSVSLLQGTDVTDQHPTHSRPQTFNTTLTGACVLTASTYGATCGVITESGEIASSSDSDELVYYFLFERLRLMMLWARPLTP